MMTLSMRTVSWSCSATLCSYGMPGGNLFNDLLTSSTTWNNANVIIIIHYFSFKLHCGRQLDLAGEEKKKWVLRNYVPQLPLNYGGIVFTQFTHYHTLTFYEEMENINIIPPSEDWTYICSLKSHSSATSPQLLLFIIININFITSFKPSIVELNPTQGTVLFLLPQERSSNMLLRIKYINTNFSMHRTGIGIVYVGICNVK